MGAARICSDVPRWDLVDCDFCGRPVKNGEVHVRVFGQGGHRGEAHLRCPWWGGIDVAPVAAIADWVRNAELGVWDVPEPCSFAEYKEAVLLALSNALMKGEVDSGLEDLLLTVNSHPRVCTSCSCRGHDGQDGGIQMHTDDGWPSRRLKRMLSAYRDQRHREWDRTYSKPGHWFVTVSVPAEDGAFRVFHTRLLEALGLA